jgi:hypothetical protein
MRAKGNISFLSPILMLLIFTFSADGGTIEGNIVDAVDQKKLAAINVRIFTGDPKPNGGISNASGYYSIVVNASFGTKVQASYGGRGYETCSMEITIGSETIKQDISLVKSESTKDTAYWMKVIQNSSSPDGPLIVWRQSDLSALARVSFSQALDQTAPQVANQLPELRIYSETNPEDAKLLNRLVQETLNNNNSIPGKIEVVKQRPSLKGLPDLVIANIFADNLKTVDKVQQQVDLGIIGATWGPNVQKQTQTHLSKAAEMFGKFESP